MIFAETRLADLFVIQPEEQPDERGFFARTFCLSEFRAHAIDMQIVQSSISFNRLRGTVRGMHFQIPPQAEQKLVRCTQGAIFDVVVDLRRESNTFGNWLAIELTAEDHKALYIPHGFAHGFQTLKDDCEVFYQMGQVYSPEHARGVRWNDSAFNIQWPLPVCCISEKDNSYRDFQT